MRSSDDIEGIDISHHQGDIDWTLLTLENSGKKFIIAKATEGASFQDRKFLANYEAMAKAGFQIGAYHFLRFTSSAADQMANFLGQLKKAQGWNRDAMVVLDVEKEENTGSISEIVEECVRIIKAEGITPIIYTSTSFWNKWVPSTPAVVAACPLWIARYRATEPSSSELPRGWAKWHIWQYSDSGIVSGIKTKTDLNKMRV